MKKALLLSIVIIIAILALPCSCFGLNEAWPLPVKIINVSGSDNTDPVKPLQNLCDGDPSTLWSTTATTPADTWFEVKLEESVIIDFIEITGAISGSADDVSVYYADSNDIWQLFLGHKHAKLVNGRIDLSWNRALTNRLRFVLHNSSHTSVLGNLGEVKVFGHKLEDLVRLSGQIVTSSEDPHYPGKFLNDHNSYTVWKAIANTNSASVTIFFPEANSINRIKFFNHGGSGVASFSAQINGVWTLFGTTVDLTSLPEGWQTIDIPDLLGATAIKLDLTTSGTNQPGGLAEVEVWGKECVQSKQTLLLAENLTGSTAVGFDLDNTTTWDEAAIWLTLPAGVVNFTPLISVNGNKCNPIITLLPAGNCTLAKIPLPLDQLATGHNIFNLNLGPVSADDAVLILSCDNGSLNITSIKSCVGDLPDLFDGNRYTATPVSGDTLEVDLNSTAAVDEIGLFSNSPLTLNYTNISIWQNNSWLPLDPAKLQNDGMVIKINGGTSPTQKIRIHLEPQNIAALTEIEVIGSQVNDGPPVVTITAPTNSNVTAGSYITIEGFVDNAQNITVNGINAIIQGYYFSCSVYVNTDSNGIFKVTALATNSQGRTGQAEKSYYFNQSTTDPLPIITCSLPEVFYTTNSQLNIQGNVTNASEVKINSVSTNLNSGVYSSSVNLVEGANKVIIEAFSSSGAIVSLERMIILDTEAPVLMLSNQTIASGYLTIHGSCIDTSPITLSINGTVVPVSNNSFSYSIQLVYGENSIFISAKDSMGHESTLTVTKNMILDNLGSSSSEQNSSQSSSANSDLDLVALYNVPDMSTYKDKNPYWNCIENSKETVSPVSGSLSVEVSDIVLPGRDGFNLEIKRMYNSNQAQCDSIYAVSGNTARTIPIDAFGNCWNLNIPYIESITQINNKSYKNLHLPDGQSIKIINNVTEYNEGIYFSLIYSDQNKNFTLTMNDGTVYILDNTGKVTSKTSPSGQNILLFYYNGRELDRIEDSIDPANRVARFIYQTVGSQRVIKTIKVGGRTITYQYNSNGLLWKVISPWEVITDPRNRTTEYDYTSCYNLTFGTSFYEDEWVEEWVWDDFFGKFVKELVLNVLINQDNHKDYKLYLLNSIKYPTNEISAYTYSQYNQNYDGLFKNLVGNAYTGLSGQQFRRHPDFKPEHPDTCRVI